MPVGVPEDMFYQDESIQREPNSILSFVRISPAKKIEQLIEALGNLKQKGVPFTATICGDATPELKNYEATLHQQVKDLGLEEQVTFTPGISYEKVRELYNKHEISVNQSPSGMFDKTIFEAMLCGTLVLSCNENLKKSVDERLSFTENNSLELAERLEALLRISSEEKEKIAQDSKSFAINNHSLSKLTSKLTEELS